jgi:uncharacterized protein YdaU (DUF1376 family)
MNYYSHHIGDFNSGTKNFTRLERWIYRDMLELYYDSEKPLPGDFDILCDELGISGSEEQAAVSRILRRKFDLVDGEYQHLRCEAEICAYQRAAEETQPVILANPTLTGLKANQEPITKNQEPKEKVKTTVEPSGPTARVFQHWQTVMDKPRAQLDAKRSKAIAGRLKDGYTPEQLCRAIDGCRQDSFSMGQNDRNTPYNDIELICRDGSKVDRFIAIADRGGAGSTSNLHVSHLDHSSSRRAMEESMRKHGITEIPEGEIEF